LLLLMMRLLLLLLRFRGIASFAFP